MQEENQRAELIRYVANRLKKAQFWRKASSAVHHGFLFGAAILSAAAAVLLQLEFASAEPLRNNIASVLAGLGSLAGIIAGAGGFERKWRTNRRTRAKLEELEIDLVDPTVDTEKIRNLLKDVVRTHDEGISGPAP